MLVKHLTWQVKPERSSNMTYSICRITQAEITKKAVWFDSLCLYYVAQQAGNQSTNSFLKPKCISAETDKHHAYNLLSKDKSLAQNHCALCKRTLNQSL